MTVEWFDLAQRVYAQRSGAVVARLAGTPLPTISRPVAVRARAGRGGPMVVAAAAGQVRRASGSDVLPMLASLGVTVAEPTPATLVTADTATLPVLVDVARRSPADGPDEATAAHIGWWADRADFPGGIAVVNTVTAARARWVTGTTPAAERDPATWRTWLGISDDSVAGTLALLAQLTAAPPLRLLDALADDDTYSYQRAQEAHADGWGWRRRDSVGRAAVGLLARCDAADLYTAALRTDPLWRRRALHTGDVVTGTLTTTTPGRRARLTLRSPRLDARLRRGTDIEGWLGPAHTPTPSAGVRFDGLVDDTGVTGTTLDLHLSISGGMHGLTPGDTLTVMPLTPSPYSLQRGRRTMRTLYSTRTSWLTTGRTPTPTRRDVPLDVLIAGADN